MTDWAQHTSAQLLCLLSHTRRLLNTDRLRQALAKCTASQADALHAIRGLLADDNEKPDAEEDEDEDEDDNASAVTVDSQGIPALLRSPCSARGLHSPPSQRAFSMAASSARAVHGSPCSTMADRGSPCSAMAALGSPRSGSKHENWELAVQFAREHKPLPCRKVATKEEARANAGMKRLRTKPAAAGATLKRLCKKPSSAEIETTAPCEKTDDEDTATATAEICRKPAACESPQAKRQPHVPIYAAIREQCQHKLSLLTEEMRVGLYPDGCSKCRWVVGCTNSCWKQRLFVKGGEEVKPEQKQQQPQEQRQPERQQPSAAASIGDRSEQWLKPFNPEES